MILEKEEIINLLGGDFLQMSRINFNGYRVYCLKDEDVKVYSGLTGALSKATFKGNQEEKRLDSWRTDFVDTFGKAAHADYMNFTADFGTLLHEALFRIWTFKKINWQNEADTARKAFEDTYLKAYREPDYYVINKMVLEYQKHVASLMQWVHERVTEIYAIETMAKCDDLQIATPIDVVCKMRLTPKGTPVVTTVNIKTSSQVSNKQLDQVEVEKYLWNKTYKNLQAEATAIVRTKNWKKSPSYEVKKSDRDVNSIISRLLLCKDDPESTYISNPSYYNLEGETKIGEEPKIKLVTLNDFI